LTNDNKRDEPGSEDLLFHCAAGLRKPMSEIARHYEEEFGVKVHLQFGGSGALASQLELAGGDLYLPADQSYIDSAREKICFNDWNSCCSAGRGFLVVDE
jgi:molybdate transport system substrate-binding protein